MIWLLASVGSKSMMRSLSGIALGNCKQGPNCRGNKLLLGDIRFPVKSLNPVCEMRSPCGIALGNCKQGPNCRGNKLLLGDIRFADR